MTYLWLLSLKNDVNVPKEAKKIIFCWHLEGHWREEQDPEAGIHNTSTNTHEHSQNTGASHLYSVTIRSQAIWVQNWTNVKHLKNLTRSEGKREQDIPCGFSVFHGETLLVTFWMFSHGPFYKIWREFLDLDLVPDLYSEYGSRFSIRNSSSRQRLQSALYMFWSFCFF